MKAYISSVIFVSLLLLIATLVRNINFSENFVIYSSIVVFILSTSYIVSILYKIVYIRFKYNNLYKDLRANCRSFYNLDASDPLENDNLRAMYNIVSTYFLKMSQLKVYTTPYQFIITNKKLLLSDMIYALDHINKERDILNCFDSISFMKYIDGVYENKQVESNEVVKKRWSVFIEKLHDCDERTLLIDKFEKRFGRIKSKEPIINHINENFM